MSLIAHVLEWDSAEMESKLTLPYALARYAKAAGLLTPDAIMRLLREAARHWRADRFFGAADRLAAWDLPSISESEVESVIEAARVI